MPYFHSSSGMYPSSYGYGHHGYPSHHRYSSGYSGYSGYSGGHYGMPMPRQHYYPSSAIGGYYGSSSGYGHRPHAPVVVMHGSGHRSRSRSRSRHGHRSGFLGYLLVGRGSLVGRPRLVALLATLYVACRVFVDYQSCMGGSRSHYKGQRDYGKPDCQGQVMDVAYRFGQQDPQHSVAHFSFAGDLIMKRRTAQDREGPGREMDAPKKQ
ncbi:hypothetical protein GGX14DRAFT_606018 [Mycena pura]|uniref:Uncharacterized protein n=1 Tax=Mycena pura TaxID=153505 RepID=A0AAD6XY55_9AGAR|nr:hypothetical protein GGX14DRAFT_606018 [Mycena pura]